MVYGHFEPCSDLFVFVESSTTSNHLNQFAKMNDYNDMSSSSSGINSSSSTPPRDLSFNIHLKYDVHKIKISDTSTVADLKVKIMSVTSIPPCRQSLTGWIPNEETCSDSTILRTLNLDQTNELILKDLSDEEYMDDDGLDYNSRENEIFTINITRQPDGDKFTLQFPGKQTLLDIKTDVYTLTTIPVRHQIWRGWPDNIANHTTLAQSGVESVVNVTLTTLTRPSDIATSSLQSTSASNTSPDAIEVDNSDENSSDDNDFQDANDDFNDYYTDTTIRRPIEDLSKLELQSLRDRLS